MTPVRVGVLLVLMGAAGYPVALPAQDTVVVVQRRGSSRGALDISSRAARDAVARFNRAATQVYGEMDIPAGEELSGDVGVFGGPALAAEAADRELVERRRVDRHGVGYGSHHP